MSEDRKKYAAHELLLLRLDETIGHTNELYGDLYKAGEFAETVACVLVILNLLAEVIIPEKHLGEVIQSLEQIREKFRNPAQSTMAGIGDALTGLIVELGKDRK